jgi:N-acylneuraminate cytidylyltransferase/CMP-N,N'-diacetyllegionaminic acid synthase
MVEILALIPARGGSKRVPHKNLLPVAHKPLIAWTIEAARAAKSLTRVVVSTDSEAIAAVSVQYGAEVPFIRPAELAQDHTCGMAPILHAVRWLDQHEAYQPDLVMCLQATSPLRAVADIEATIDLALQQHADAVVSLTPVPYQPAWMKQVDSRGRIRDWLPGTQWATRCQDGPAVYALNGAIYLARRQVLLTRQNWYGDNTYAYVMPPERSLDVDTPWDMSLADVLLRERQV